MQALRFGGGLSGAQRPGVGRAAATGPATRPACAPLLLLPAGPRSRRLVARGILDSYRKQQQSSGGNGVSLGTTSSVSISSGEDSDAPVVESLLMEEGIHFTEDDTPCPTDCVLEVYTEDELNTIFKSALPDALVVIDFFKTDCSACKYMAPGFHRMCRSASEHAQHIIFVKHNVYDADEELTGLARSLKIKSVPLFQLYKANGTQLVESFATRDKARLIEAVDKHAPVAVERWDDE